MEVPALGLRGHLGKEGLPATLRSGRPPWLVEVPACLDLLDLLDIDVVLFGLVLLDADLACLHHQMVDPDLDLCDVDLDLDFDLVPFQSPQSSSSSKETIDPRSCKKSQAATS